MININKGGSSHEKFPAFCTANCLFTQAGRVGTAVPVVCCKMGIAEQTFYRWKKKYIGMGVAEVRKLKAIEDEDRKLK